MPSPRGLVQWVDQELHRIGIIPRHARLLVAVSGGADSVALLRLLVAINGSDYWGWKLVVGHIDHGMRGRQSRADARFVELLAEQLRLPYVVRRLKLSAGSSEDTARTARLAALAAMVKTKRCEGVIMAHHQDDQAETVLMRMMRGCGLDGLAGMQPRTELHLGRTRLTVYRPLLCVRREALRTYLRFIGQTWREDATNAQMHYRRNRVRGEVLPMMEEVSPGAGAAICRLAQLAADARIVLADLSKALAGAATIADGGRRIVLRRKILQTANPLIAGEVVRAAVESLGGTREIADFERVREVVRLASGTAGGKSVQLGKGVLATFAGPTLTIERKMLSRRKA